jgi:tetratricopeptide (TPR) repeat protein
MRARCHGCRGLWEFPDSAAAARCPACALLAGVPRKKALVGATGTVEPADHLVLGVSAEPKPEALKKAWVQFLSKVPADRHPAAFRQGRGAYDRLRALSEAPRRTALWSFSGTGCFLCDEMAKGGHPHCLVCSRPLAPQGEPPSPARGSVRPTSGSKPFLLAVREAEMRWRVRKAPEALAAAERGLAEPEVTGDEPFRARLHLLAGHALLATGKSAEARLHWMRVARDRTEGPEARLALAAVAYREGDCDEAIHHLDASADAPSSSKARLRIAALGGASLHSAAVEAGRAAVREAKDPTLHWMLATAEYETGNPSGALDSAHEAARSLTGDAPASGFARELPAALLWLGGVAAGSLGALDEAERWLTEGATRFPDDPSFPRERGHVALRQGRWDAARLLFDETRRKGDSAGAARGVAFVDSLGPGGRGADALAAEAERLGDAELFHAAGRLHERRGRVSDAAKAHLLAIKADPRFFPSLRAVGILFLRQGSRGKAIETLRRALELGDRSDDLLRALSTALLAEGELAQSEPLLEELRGRFPGDRSVRHNAAFVNAGLALAAANAEREEEAAERLGTTRDLLEGDGGTSGRDSADWSAVASEVSLRAGWRVLRSSESDRFDRALDHFARAAELDQGNDGAAIARGLARLGSLAAGGGSTPIPGPDSEERLVEARRAAEELEKHRDDPRATLGAAIARLVAGDRPLAASGLDRLTALSEGSSAFPLRAAWVRSVLLAGEGKPAEARALLEEQQAAREVPAGFARLIGLQILKLRAAERGPLEIEKEIRSLAASARTAESHLLYGIILAAEKRFDEAEQILNEAARSPGARAEAVSTRRLMQMARLAELIRSGRPADAAKLLTRLRPGLPQDPEIDHWLRALEDEAVPLAALRNGNGKLAIQIWSARLASWNKGHDSSYWELVRSLAIAAHRSAIDAEKGGRRLDAETFWKCAVDRWLEIAGSEPFWNGYSARCRDLISGFEPELVPETVQELVERYLSNGLREVIGHLRATGEELVAAERFDHLDRILAWRMNREGATDELRQARATCHAQRLIIYSNAKMWEPAVRFGELACEADPTDPVHFNNLAEVFGAQAQPLIAEINAAVAAGMGGPHLRSTAMQIADLLSIALAWNPYHAVLRRLHGQIAPQIGYVGVGSRDPRARRAEQLRASLPPRALELFSMRQSVATGGDAGSAGFPQIVELATNLKAVGITDPEVIYAMLVATNPLLGQLDKGEVLRAIRAA